MSMPLTHPVEEKPCLPAARTRFFGREADLSRLQELLRPVESASAPRLITLTGPGGSGKTRLALEAVQRAAKRFNGAVWFVPLADLTDSRLLPEAIARALELPPSALAHPFDEILTQLNRQPSLLVLDNMEHLLAPVLPEYSLRDSAAPDGAASVWKLMTRAPALTLLITSRIALELGGEQDFPVLPLPVPEANAAGSGKAALEQISLFPGVQLFVDRAQATAPDFLLTPDNAPAVAALCARLEGIPLAIELAAAHARTLSPAQMLAQLEQRFDFLVSQQQEIPERHRTLYTAIAWSYHNLPPELRRFFARLSVFRGGWNVTAAEAVACVAEDPEEAGEEANTYDGADFPPDAFDSLTQLQAHSLVTAREVGGTMRFSMLETLREFAAGQLTPKARNGVEQRHAEYYLSLADEAAQPRTGESQAARLARLDTEADNLRAVMDRYLRRADGLAEEAQKAEGRDMMRLTTGLFNYWRTRGQVREGQHYLEAALAHPGTQEPTQARAAALNNLGLLFWMQGDGESAQACYEECLRIHREEKYPPGIGSVLHNISHLFRDRQEFARATEYAQEALQQIREIGDVVQEGVILNTLGLLAMARKDYAQARACYEESLRLRRVSGDMRGVAIALYNLGEAAANQEAYAEARSLYEESLQLCLELGENVGILCGLEAFAYLALKSERTAEAIRLFFAADRFRTELGVPIPPADSLTWEPDLATAQSLLGETAYAQAMAEGRALSLEAAIALAQEIAAQGQHGR